MCCKTVIWRSFEVIIFLTNSCLQNMQAPSQKISQDLQPPRVQPPESPGGQPPESPRGQPPKSPNWGTYFLSLDSSKPLIRGSLSYRDGG